MWHMVILGVIFLIGSAVLFCSAGLFARRGGRVFLVLRLTFWAFALCIAYGAWVFYQSTRPEAALEHMLGVEMEDGIEDFTGSVTVTADWEIDLHFSTSLEVSKRIVEHLEYEWAGGDHTYKKENYEECVDERLKLSEGGTRVHYRYLAY